MSIFMRKSLMFRISCLSVFGLTFVLTSCDKSDPSSVDLDSTSIETPSSDFSSSKIVESAKLSKINDKLCDETTEGRYLSEYYCVEYNEKNRYYKCENGGWTSLSSEEAPVADSLMLHTYFWNNRCKITFRIEYERESSDFQECKAENDGLVDSIWTNYSELGKTYYKCEKNSWTEMEWYSVCDTAGASVGEIRTITKTMSERYGVQDTILGVYVGDGVCYDLDSLAKSSKECSAENKGAVEIYGTEPMLVYYKCTGDEWVRASEIDYKCATENKSANDTCSFEVNGEKQYYLYVYDDSTKANIWVKSNSDSALGLCPISADAAMQMFGEFGKEFYYCEYGKWLPAKLVPQQYTDPRKEGLTDEEYDVLDLPKDASTGDRVGGLLEECWNDDFHVEFYGGDYFCLSKNYYRYENGSWTLETEADRENDNRFDVVGTECTKEEVGSVSNILPSSRQPGITYQCVIMKRCRDDSTVPKEAVCPGSDEGTIVYLNYKTGYTFGRSKKK